MPTDILMPALSPTMEEGTLAKWHVREGDTVQTGDVIAEIETDKATMEVEAIEDGVIQSILVAEGTEHVPVNQPIAVLQLEDDEALTIVGGRLRKQPVTVGLRSDLQLEIRDGLSESDTIVAKPDTTMTDGMAVAPASSPPRGED